MKKTIIQIILFTIPFVTFATTVDELVQIHAVTTAERTALVSPVDGNLAFDSTVEKLYVYVDAEWRELVFVPKIIEKTGDYTLIQSDNGSILTFNSLADVTLTIPSGFPIGFNVSIYQTNTGKVTMVGSGTTVLNRLSRFKTAGLDAGVGIVSTAINVYHLTGDLRR